MDALLSRRGLDTPPRLWDGALGSELVAARLDLDREPPEAWTLSHPERLLALHARYLAAGAEVVQTNTFGASRPRLERYGLDGELRALNRRAVELAREAGAVRVVASLGPTGIDPYSKEDARAIEAAYAEQVAALVEAEPDGLHFETQYHPVEARAGLRAARRVAPWLPVLVSATYAPGDQGFQTPLGVPLARMTDALLDEEAGPPDALGVNCSLEARKLLGVLRALRERTELPLLVQPQGGEPSVGCKGERRGDTPERFAHDALRFVDEGADGVGGCCGAGPAYISALRAALPDALDATCRARPGSRGR